MLRQTNKTQLTIDSHFLTFHSAVRADLLYFLFTDMHEVYAVD